MADLFFVSRFCCLLRRVWEEAALRGCRPPKRGGFAYGFAFRTLGSPFLEGMPCSNKRFCRSRCRSLFSTYPDLLFSSILAKIFGSRTRLSPKYSKQTYQKIIIESAQVEVLS